MKLLKWFSNKITKSIKPQLKSKILLESSFQKSQIYSNVN